MSLQIHHALPFDSSLSIYLSSMTVSWTRKKLPIKKSSNGLAFWNGVFIGVPDLRDSAYTFVLDHSLEKQFSFYSALVFHECMHAKYNSHKANRNKLVNNTLIPSNLLNFAYFIYNVIEDGRIERLGIIKRKGSVIHHQLLAFNILISESNWKNFEEREFTDYLDKFVNHVINQLFDLVLLGKNFLNTFIDNSEKNILEDFSDILIQSVFNSFDPNSSINATISFFEIVQKYLNFSNQESQKIQFPEFQNQCQITQVASNLNEEDHLNFEESKLEIDNLNEFLNNPFSDIISNEENTNDQTETGVRKLNDKHKYRNSENKSDNENKIQNIERDNSSNNDLKVSTKKSLKKRNKIRARVIPKYSHTQESTAYSKFLEHNEKAGNFSEFLDRNDTKVDYLDTFGNDMSVSDIDTEFDNFYEKLNNYQNDYIDKLEFNSTYERLTNIATNTANYFLQLAGINLQKKDGVGNQKIIISSQKNGKLYLSGNTLSQLLAGNKYIYNKEMPARINITLDLVLLIDLTGSMEFEVYCDCRNATRLDFVNEATIILAETLNLLQKKYHLPITFSIIGYNAPDGSQPLLKIIKTFESPYTGKKHAEAIIGMYPDGENCDARAIYESVTLLTNNHSKSENKVIFFLSDGGGEQGDLKVVNQIREEFPNFVFKGPKDYTDAIRYALIKGIKTYIFNLESFQHSLNNFDIKLAFNQYYGENFYLVENLNDLISIFSKCLLELFSKK